VAETTQEASMKTMAIRLDDEVAEFLSILATLESTSIIDQIREAIMSHLSRKMADGALAERAQAALDDIDREASARKQAISTLLAAKAGMDEGPPKGRTRRPTLKPVEDQAHPIGLAPPQAPGSRGSRGPEAP
jgi:predicted DNA-binding protein